MKTYFYHTALGKARVVIDEKVKVIGNFKNEAEAKEACLSHHAKACKAARNFGRPNPTALWA